MLKKDERCEVNGRWKGIRNVMTEKNKTNFTFEKWDAYTRDGKLTDTVLVRGESIPEGLYHLVCEVLVRHKDGSFLCMKRSMSKSSYPGYYEATAGGAAIKGEDKIQCIKRELEEETGIICNDFTEIGCHIYDEDQCIFYSFVCCVDCDKNSIKLQEGETEGYKWLTKAEFIDFVTSDQMMKGKKNRYFREIMMLNLDNYSHIRAIHIVKDNKVVFEQSREVLNDTQLFPVACIFKSFLSVLMGIAIYEGKIQSLEDCVLDYFQYEDVNDINWYKLKVKHALSKTTGIVWPGPKAPTPANMDEVMQLKFESEPGTAFKYKPDPQIIVYLLEEVYGMGITKLFKTKLLSYFKNKSYQWDREDIQGMKVSIRVLDELGQLMLNKGMVGEKRLFSEEYYEQSICKYSNGGFPECVPYGLGWWLNVESEIPYFCASGFGGQDLIVVPQKNMTISILCDMDRPHPENKKIIELALQFKDSKIVDGEIVLG